jgi:hypothetical protein
MVKAIDKHRIVDLTPAQAATWREAAAPSIDEWAKTTPDGVKILSTFRDLLARVRAGS